MLHALGRLGPRERRAHRSWPPSSAETSSPASATARRATRFEDAFEKRYVSWLLERHEGNVSAAAREADMDRKYLHKLAKKHGLRGD